jgi:DNA-binding transcriptional LysR family regulator
MDLRLNDLRNFLKMGSSATFSEGAKILGISQPALSESIARLEKDLGEILFYRSKSGVTLTPSGRVAIDKTRRVFDLLTEFKSDAKTNDEAPLPVVTIGCHPVVGLYVLPQALKRLQLLQPRYRLDLQHGLSRSIQAEIQKGMIDLGVVINPVSNPDLIIRKWGKDSMRVWRSAKVVPQNQILGDLDLIQTQEILRRWKKRPSSIMASSSLELIGQLTEAGVGFGILPARVVSALKLNLIAVEDAPEFQDEIALVSRPEFGKTIYEKQIIKALSESPPV